METPDVDQRRPQSNLSPRYAFAILHNAFTNINGAGINLPTEILHTLDNRRFAVMNQNSVAGLRLAGYNEFPQHPPKANVSANSYQLYCNHAEAVRKAFWLRDFTELDALFNYVYWNEDQRGHYWTRIGGRSWKRFDTHLLATPAKPA